MKNLIMQYTIYIYMDRHPYIILNQEICRIDKSLGPRGKSLGPRCLLSLWSQVRALCCSYDGHWRLIWSLTSGAVGLVEVRASWPGHPR